MWLKYLRQTTTGSMTVCNGETIGASGCDYVKRKVLVAFKIRAIYVHM